MAQHVYIMKLTHDHRKPYNITTSMFMSWWFLEVLFEQHGSRRVPTLFVLCINKLEEIVMNIAKEEGLDGPNLCMGLFLLLYEDNVLFFA